METLGIWLGPVIGAVIVVIGIPAGLRFRSHRGRAIKRLAGAFAAQYSHGYPEQYDAWLEYFTGRRENAEGINLIKPEDVTSTPS
jgi:hypothetical protein